MEVQEAKFLLMRLRNEERNLKKSALERERKGLEEYMFDVDERDHKEAIKAE